MYISPVLREAAYLSPERLGEMQNVESIPDY